MKTDLIDESAAYNLIMLNKIKELVKNRVVSASVNDKPHYQALLVMLKSLEK